MAVVPYRLAIAEPLNSPGSARCFFDLLVSACADRDGADGILEFDRLPLERREVGVQGLLGVFNRTG